MAIKNSFFVKSITDIKYSPFPRLKEIFLIGRSNVGKSFFIRVLTNNNKISFVSKTPGKTSTLNYFLLNNSFYLIDSPGYGYMKKSKLSQRTVFPMIQNFLQKNKNIKMILQIIDFKVGPTKMDLFITQELAKHNFKLAIILNKSDKVSKNHILKQLNFIKNTFELSNYLNDIPMYLLSCKTKEGLREIESLVSKQMSLNN
ncbi:ribosome biogenesis GTP-binding protein YsxC [Candidatus Phytoplasma phoenicium]|uniref:Probable GTP-binding protein EngB n=1 Tax=Candidatus Phytoplasma phoenicium TaxID=198422 RepID=A0A2S8NV18_9MOLU|nr:ribosome biogenesis GTP-binding protein YsxC [Candidatus Phytoplasma phoenicium]